MEHAPLYAEVIIPLALPTNYTWAIGQSFEKTALVGCRVEVSLKNKKYAGIVKRLHYEPPSAFIAKNILQVLDTEPIIFPRQLELWTWMAAYYVCTEGEVMAAALPAHFKLSSQTILMYNEEFGEDFSSLNGNEFLIAEALSVKKELTLSEFQQILDSVNIYPVLHSLIEKKLCYVWEELKETFVEKKDTFVVLNDQYNNEAELSRLLNEDKKLKRAEKQVELLLSYLHISKSQGKVTKNDLLKKSGASDAQLKGLVEKKILFIEKRKVDRINYLPPGNHIDFELTVAQQQAFTEIDQSLITKPVCLLHGVTSSGKTEIYIKLIAQIIKTGKQVLYLLPEIALTSQIVRRLQKIFGGHIGIYHSKFSHNERLEIWRKIRNRELMIILGVRSALLLPFTDLGLIIVDEEHDGSYKQQEPAPRYHARDAAIYYASLFNAKVLLGSATPSMESFFNASHNKYGLVTLKERFGGVDMPAIELIDSKTTIGKHGQKAMLTPALRTAIEESLSARKQVILFQNRRGYSPYQICRVCGWIPQCRNCDVSLAFHKITNKLHCHYCGTEYPLVNTCAACGNHHFIQSNFGTERIEEYLAQIFPNAVVARMDFDSVRGKLAHDQLIRSIEDKRIDILVGTQMVVKGLDFENVNLVGILDADALLNFADFRVNERAFQLMEQVSGRAGRRDGRGKVMIQVAHTAHPVLDFVKKHDYRLFFDYEIGARQRFFYPPYSRIILLQFKHKIAEIANSAAHLFANHLKKDFGQWLVGPAEPMVNRVRNLFQMVLLLKLPKDAKTLQFAKNLIQQQIISIHSEKRYRNVIIIPDVDAV